MVNNGCCIVICSCVGIGKKIIIIVCDVDINIEMCMDIYVVRENVIVSGINFFIWELWWNIVV